MAARRRSRRTAGQRGGASAPVEAPRPRLGGPLAQIVEHAVASALRRAVDVGGARLAAALPEAGRMRRDAGAYLQELRELAGLTRAELAEAIELSDRSLIDAVEAGTATLSFELILRLAAILARHDPVPFVSRLVRTYNPVLFDLLRDWGVGQLPLQLEREREFVNILRGRDQARELSDAEFARVLDFTRAAFEMALQFASGRGKPTASGSPARPRSRRRSRPRSPS